MTEAESHGKRIRGRTALALMRDLALSDTPVVELAERYGFAPESISRFKTRNAEAIAEIKADEQSEIAGLWIARKRERIAAYQEQVERIDDFLTDGAPTADLMRVQQAALRSVAEETGQLRHQVETTQRITYAVEGIDPQALR